MGYVGDETHPVPHVPMTVSPRSKLVPSLSTASFVEPQPFSDIVPVVSSHELHDQPPRLGVRLYVALRRRQVRVTGERLDVPQRPADRRDLSGGVGDEGPPSRVARASDEAELGVPAGEQVHDRLGGGSGSPARS